MFGFNMEWYTQIIDAFDCLVNPVVFGILAKDEAWQTQIYKTRIKCRGWQLEKSAVSMRVWFGLLFNDR
jgi:hypothetical protein